MQITTFKHFTLAVSSRRDCRVKDPIEIVFVGSKEREAASATAPWRDDWDCVVGYTQASLKGSETSRSASTPIEPQLPAYTLSAVSQLLLYSSRTDSNLPIR